jgi:hypothetical protein
MYNLNIINNMQESISIYRSLIFRTDTFIKNDNIISFTTQYNPSWEGNMSKTALIIRSYANAIDPGALLQRLPAIVIALWLGVISISMIPQMNILEGGFMFLFFLISTLLLESAFNPKKIKNKKIAQAIRTLGYKNYKFLIIFHLGVTILLSLHISYILEKYLILFIVVFGLVLSIINSRFITRLRSHESLTNMTTVASSIALPMVGAFFIIGNTLDFLTISIFVGVSFIYLGILNYESAKSDLELAPGLDNQNSVEWEALKVVEELNLSNSLIKQIGVQLHNIRNEKDFTKIPPEDCALFLPHCLRTAERCKATYNEDGLQCKHCTKTCKVHLLTQLGSQMGYRCFVVPGGAMVFNIAKKFKPKGVVAVACLNELREGTARTESEYKVPFQIVQLTKDGCVNTEVCVDEVEDVMLKKFRGDYTSN